MGIKAKGLLLQLIAANGGRIHRGALHKAINELMDQDLVAVEFEYKGQPRSIKHHTEYDYVLTKKGQAATKKTALLEKGTQDQAEKLRDYVAIEPLETVTIKGELKL